MAGNIDKEKADRDELLALYKNAADNITYFKQRVFLLAGAFTAGTGFLWKFMLVFSDGKETLLLPQSLSIVVLGFFELFALLVMGVLMTYNENISRHRERIDRCCGLIQVGRGPTAKAVKTNQFSFGNAFYYARTGRTKEETIENFRELKNNFASHRDWGDVATELPLLFYIFLITAFTGYVFCLAMQPEVFGMHVFIIFLFSFILLHLGYLLYRKRNT